MESPAFQDHVRPFGQTCYGCGQENPHGLRIRSHWEGDEGVCRWTPEPWHVAAPGVLNGGVIATLLDCHMACTATAHAYRAEGRAIGSEPVQLYVTASLHVDYLKPTPADGAVELRARVTGQQGRRITVACALVAGGQETARGEAVFVKVAGEPKP
ncbi:MAG TPA: PaaI family thioesterase [bacterium]|nr:PaaI family thioesterase [bacterium]